MSYDSLKRITFQKMDYLNVNPYALTSAGKISLAMLVVQYTGKVVSVLYKGKNLKRQILRKGSV